MSSYEVAAAVEGEGLATQTSEIDVNEDTSISA